MSLGHYLFSFAGRINRAKQWAVLLVGLVNFILIWFLFATMVGFQALIDVMQGKSTFELLLATPQMHLFGVLFCGLYILGLYIGLAVSAKRLHDRNKSAWWL